jgi:hypothetical protein
MSTGISLQRHALLLVAATFSSFASIATAMTESTPTIDEPAYVRCARIRPGMDVREMAAIMARRPDSTLNGHSAAMQRPDGTITPAGSFSIDFWHDTDTQGRQIASQVKYSGGRVISVDCGQPADSPSDLPPTSGAHDDLLAVCRNIRVGANYSEAVAILHHEPDSTLSGHTEAGPDGTPPAGSYSIDFWHGTAVDGRRYTIALRYSGDAIESIDCAYDEVQPVRHNQPLQPEG